MFYDNAVSWTTDPPNMFSLVHCNWEKQRRERYSGLNFKRSGTLYGTFMRGDLDYNDGVYDES